MGWWIALIPVAIIGVGLLLIAGIMLLIWFISPHRHRRRLPVVADGERPVPPPPTHGLARFTSTWWGQLLAFGLGVVIVLLAYNYLDPGLAAVFCLASIGMFLIYKGIMRGWTLVAVAAIVYLLGPSNVLDMGRNTGQGAKKISETGISGWWSSGETSQTGRSPVRVYDLLVPAHGCSDPIKNTNSAEWVNPEPKDPATGWPRYTEMVSPETGKGWTPYRSGARYSHLRYCDNGSEMWMTVSFYRGQL